jgi:hypothetical protein
LCFLVGFGDIEDNFTRSNRPKTGFNSTWRMGRGPDIARPTAVQCWSIGSVYYSLSLVGFGD